MAHFAKLDENNTVVKVHVVANEVLGDPESEQAGKNHLKSLYGGTDANWVQCSYNTVEGKHYTNGVESADQSKALRGHYPGKGWTYDSENNYFMPPKPFPSWVWNADKITWDPPVSLEAQLGAPTSDIYKWNEDTISWVYLGTREQSLNGEIEDSDYAV
jgi:hypothetical protein